MMMCLREREEEREREMTNTLTLVVLVPETWMRTLTSSGLHGTNLGCDKSVFISKKDIF